MNFEEVLACLENTQKCTEFILRLKNGGENSTPFLHVQSAMSELKMNKAPRSIDEKTILQHTFKFTYPHECFHSFRLVCKSWKDAVETIKFNRAVPLQISRDIDEIIKNGLPISTYFEKYLKCFKRLYAPVDILASENGNHVISLILKNMHKLNLIWFRSDYGEILPETLDPFIFQILENSHETLQYLIISRFCVPADISFPKLKLLVIEIGKNICVPEFKTYFPLVLKNMERLQTVKLVNVSFSKPDYYDVCEYIAEHYDKHCISADICCHNFEISNVAPVKILISVVDLEENLQNFKYVSGLQYLHIFIDYPKEPMTCGWDKYQQIFDQCLNLKGVELDWGDENGDAITLSQISEPYQTIWQERISYFEARRIRIVDDVGNENLKTKLAKEAGVTWKFDFH